MATYCDEYLRTEITREFDILFCRSFLISAVWRAKGIGLFFLQCVNRFLVLAVWIGKLLTKRPHIAHIHTNSYTGFHARGLQVVASKLFGTKTILHVHGGDFEEFYSRSGVFGRWLIKGFLRASDRVIVLSEKWRSFFATIGVSGEKLAVMANSVFLPRAEEKAKEADPVTVLFLSRFLRLKGIHELQEAILEKDELRSLCRFVLAGPRIDDWRTVRARFDDRGLEEIEMPGVLLGEERDRAYREAGIYILPSHSEGLPIGLLEAMSYGAACIATRVGGVPDVIDHNRNGILVEPEDVDAIADALLLLARDHELRTRLAKSARETIEEGYQWLSGVEALGRLYDSLLEGNRP